MEYPDSPDWFHRSRVPATRPHREARERRRAQLLAAAVEIFVSRGYHAAVMNDMAQRAGCSKPVFYQHFSGKLDLYLTVLRESVDMLVTGVEQALSCAVDNKSRVRAAVGAYFDYVDHETQNFRLVFESDVISEPAVQRLVDGAVDGCIEAVCAVIARHSGLDPYRAHMLATGLVGASQVAASHWLDSNRAIPKDEAVDIIVELCWGGLSTVPSQPGGPAAAADFTETPAANAVERLSA
ncbi:TetR/AcrR family transcriptional regulator [Nocardia sp. NPDC057272]|uniref:TetR/AcrR family transcriptional regulator n=1 Tax=Nocardia sp. NPDC057272 TaxID=3346079 RepID=UPI003630C25D